MPKKRLTLSKTLEKRAYQQVESKCAFCTEREIASLQVHHIDWDPSHNVLENLLVVCANCHTKVTRGVISEADVIAKKRQVEWCYSTRKMHDRTSPVVNVSITGSCFRGDIAQNITKITTQKTPRIAHPAGSVGADLSRKGYIDYLLAQYFDFRKADVSYGQARPFSFAEIHRTIQKEFGYKTFFIPVQYFDRLSEFLKWRIDRTILGRHNVKRAIPNYHSYEEHHLSNKARP